MTDVDETSLTKITKPTHWQLVSSHALLAPAVINHRYNGSGTEDDPYRVEFIANDPRDPMGFAMWKKWAITLLVAFATLAVSFVSSAYTGGVHQIIQDLHTSDGIVVLGVSLFVLGFAVGPLLWAPLSELYGCQFLFFFTYAALTAFNAGAAASQTIQTLVILRFFAGAFGSSPLTNAGGVIADMFPASQRGLAMSVFAAAPFMGPTLGPIVGGFLGETEGWRWVEGLMAIFTGSLWIIGALTIPETYAPVLLKNRAAAMSKKTGKIYKSKIECDRGGKQSLSQSFKVALSRPWVLLLKEPIVLLLSIYMAIIYGTLYMIFAAFPIVFQQNRHWSEGIGGLAFSGVAVGMIGAVIYTIPDNQRYLQAEAAGIDKGEGGAAPEARLPPSMIGSVWIPIGLFIFAWTHYPSIHWSVSIIFTAPFGFGMVLVFLSIMNYLIDSYTIYAASVLAANSVLRSTFGAIFPLFTTYMYDNLGIHWASTIPAFLALACVPFPFLFYKYGPVIRKKCKFAREAAEVMAKIKQRQPQNEDNRDEASDSDISEKNVEPTIEPEGVAAARSEVDGDDSERAARLQNPERDVEKAEV